MFKRHRDIPDGQFEEVINNATKPEQLVLMRDFRADIASKPPPDGATPEELAELDETISFLEVAIRVEAAKNIPDIKFLPEVDAIELMWDWIGDICQDRGRIAREMGIDIETTKRWSQTMAKMLREARERRREARQQGKKVATLWRAPEAEDDIDSRAVTGRSPNDLAGRPFIMPKPGQSNN